MTCPTLSLILSLSSLLSYSILPYFSPALIHLHPSIFNHYSLLEFSPFSHYTRIIKISRPMLNYLIVLGAIIFYLAVILFVIPTTDKSASLALITARSWCLSLGYSFCYGTIIMKMCRVYYIVHNPRPNKVMPIDVSNETQSVALHAI